MTGHSNGWEAVARDFIAYRSTSTIGVASVSAWASTRPPHSEVLDLGCGSGLPITRTLVNAGFRVSGIDASPTLASEFHRNFPDAPFRCEPAETSNFFGRTFDGIVSWGMMFLLEEAGQRAVIEAASRALKPGGSFLFTAPSQAFAWPDVSTGRTSVSLGHDAYVAALSAVGLRLIREHDDEEGNHYYEAVR